MKVIFLFLFAFLISSCTIASDCDDAGNREPDSISVVEYNGHRYLMFERYGGLAATSYSLSVVHDPDCHCFSDIK